MTDITPAGIHVCHWGGDQRQDRQARARQRKPKQRFVHEYNKSRKFVKKIVNIWVHVVAKCCGKPIKFFISENNIATPNSLFIVDFKIWNTNFIYHFNLHPHKFCFLFTVTDDLQAMVKRLENRIASLESGDGSQVK